MQYMKAKLPSLAMINNINLCTDDLVRFLCHTNIEKFKI